MSTERVGRRRRSRAEVEALLKDYVTSGLRRGEFCRSRGVGVSTLAHYLRLSRQTSAGCQPPQFVAVELCDAKPGLPDVVGGQAKPLVDRSEGCSCAGSEGSSGLAVVLPGDRRIEVRRGFDAEVLEQLIRALERA